MVTRCDPVLLLDTRGGARTRIAGIDIQLLQTWKLRDRVLDHLVGAVGSGARASWLRHSSRSRSCICSNLPAAAHRRKLRYTFSQGGNSRDNIRHEQPLRTT